MVFGAVGSLSTMFSSSLALMIAALILILW